jgi:hypothetical protein
MAREGYRAEGKEKMKDEVSSTNHVPNIKNLGQ